MTNMNTMLWIQYDYYEYSADVFNSSAKYAIFAMQKSR